MSPQRKRRHHTVPKSHLRRFADDRNQLMRVVIPGTTRHRISINDATVEKDFYTVVGLDGEPSDELEDVFAELEGAAETAIEVVAVELHEVGRRGDEIDCSAQHRFNWPTPIPDTRDLQCARQRHADAGERRTAPSIPGRTSVRAHSARADRSMSTIPGILAATS
nr:DUF4238 domain-containing protein [Saccharothrix sp.]